MTYLFVDDGVRAGYAGRRGRGERYTLGGGRRHLIGSAEREARTPGRRPMLPACAAVSAAGGPITSMVMIASLADCRSRIIGGLAALFGQVKRSETVRGMTAGRPSPGSWAGSGVVWRHAAKGWRP